MIIYILTAYILILKNDFNLKIIHTAVSEFNEFKPRLKFPKNRFQLSTDLNLEKLNTILCGTSHI